MRDADTLSIHCPLRPRTSSTRIMASSSSGSPGTIKISRPTVLPVGSLRKMSSNPSSSRPVGISGSNPAVFEAINATPPGKGFIIPTFAQQPINNPNKNVISSSSSFIAPIRTITSTDLGFNNNNVSTRRQSMVFSRRGTSSFYALQQQPQTGSLLDLGERTSSKLTLDEELYDILHAFGDNLPSPTRRSSVFVDLLTVFRKNTTSNQRRRSSRYHAPPANSFEMTSEYESDLFCKDSGALTFNKAKTSGAKEADIMGFDDDNEGEDDRSGKPITRQSLLNKIRQKKQVINKLRCQPWSMNRKRRTLRLAQKYLEQNESKVSKTHLYKEELIKRWRIFLRWLSNISIYFIPFESKIKKIESQFGSVVSSYFTFLRWVIFMNLIITLIIMSLIVIPEFLADATNPPGRQERTASRKQIPLNEKSHADELQVVWHYDGYLRYSPLFYGYYANESFVMNWFSYPLPLIYFIAILSVFCCSFCAILRKMALNARMSKLAGSKAEQYIFNWKVFTGWDYSIGNVETAGNTSMAAVIKLREAINECQVQKTKKIQLSQVLIRIISNLIILGMIAFSIYCIYFAVQSSETVEKTGSLFTKNQVPSVVSTITHVFPMIFDLIGRIEKHHPKMQLRLHLIRVLTLYVINYGTLIFALFEKLDNIRDTKSFDEHAPTSPIPETGRKTRHLKEKMEHNLIGKNLGFSSRNFSNPHQLFRFFNRHNSLQSKILHSSKNIRYKRQDYVPPTQTTPTGGEVTVDGTTVVIHSQFGPVGVNNPSALLRNISSALLTTSATGSISFQAGYETHRLGPTPLPVFTPPPLPPTIETPTFRKQTFGPDWKLKNATKKTERNFNSNEEVTLEQNVFTTTQIVQEKEGENAKISSNEDEAFKYNDNICWETVIGQEIVKLVTMDLYITIASILVIDFLRGYWIRCCSSWWCWDIETTFPEYGEFKVAENVLHIVNNQGMIWLGLFFAPLLPAINNVKMITVMYIRAWACMTCNVPAREIFRASRSSNFYLLILLFWLLLCTLPVGYVITSKRPSTICGPFAGKEKFYDVITDLIEAHVSKKVLKWLRYIASPGVIIPIILLLMLMIFFLVSLVRGLREANTDLQKQLVHERTEEKKKIFELAGGNHKKKTTIFDVLNAKQTKKPPQYLPEVEQKRREPWRLYNGTDHAPSLCPSDEPPSSLNSPASTNESPQIRPNRPQNLRIPKFGEIYPTGDLSPTKNSFIPALGSLDEGENSECVSTPNYDKSTHSNLPGSASKDMGISMSKSTSMASRVAEPDDDGASAQNDDRFQKTNDSHTPEEIRSLIIPYMVPRSFFANSLVSDLNNSLSTVFPTKEITRSSISTTNPITVIFGTNGVTSDSVSKRFPSRRQSFMSLYDNTVEEIGSAPTTNNPSPKFDAKSLTTSSQPILQQYNNSEGHALGIRNEKTSKKIILCERSIPITNISQSTPFVGDLNANISQPDSRSRSNSMSRSSNLDLSGGIPAMEAPQRISIYSKEPRRVGTAALPPHLKVVNNASVNVVPSAALPPQPPIKQPTVISVSRQRSKTPVESKTIQSTSSKFAPSDLKDQFVPWPSIEEVKAQRANLFSSKNKPPRGRSPPKMVRSENSKLQQQIQQPGTSYVSGGNENQPTRFRISVSPTRKLAESSDDNASDTESSTGGFSNTKRKTRYVIKQHLLAGSTSSFGSALMPQRTPPTGERLAPRVEFGDDDSPKVQQLPIVEK